MSNVDLLQMTISELAPKIQNKEVSPVELTEAALAEADRLQPTLNSFITILHDRAMDQARESESAISRGDYRGPLHGIPIGLKDNLATAGITTTVGSKVLANHVPEEDAEVVTRCRNAGAILIGKENLEEFAAGATSNNPHYGAVHNPWGLDHIPGGSSGGGGAHLWYAPFLLLPRLEFVFFSTCRTVSRQIESAKSSSTTLPASNRKVQRVCPSGAGLQATATKWASCLPSSLRCFPGRGRSLRARSNPPSTKRWRTRLTVEGPTITASATCWSVRPSSALHKIKDRFTLRADDLPRRVRSNKCSRSSWVKSTRYRLAGIPHTPHTD